MTFDGTRAIDKNYMSIIPTDRIAILGGSDSGKSHTTYVIIKEIRRKNFPVWILDTSKDFGDLLKIAKFKKYKANKFNPETLPGKLKRTRQSAIIDFSKMKGKNDQRKYITKFIKSCFEKINNNPAIIVIDESHNFVPQKYSKKPIINDCKDMVNQLLSEGRKYGYGAIIISQRPSKIDKDSLAECKKVFIHNHTLATDIDRLKKYIGKFKYNNELIDVNEEIPSLKQGELFDVDFNKFTLQKYIIPYDKTKKQGRTPKPKAVIPIKEKWTDKFKDVDLGLNEEEKMTLGFAAIIIIIVFIIIGVVWKYESSEMIKS